jgi:hypothetical protein
MMGANESWRHNFGAVANEDLMNQNGSPSLGELQALLYHLIAAPEGVDERLADESPPVDVRALVVGDKRLDAIARVGIYADGYFYRLLDALKEDFPAVLAVAGSDQFHNLITGYLLEYPPAEPSLLYAGKYLPAYISDSHSFERWPFLADLARLERGLIESFHAAEATALSRAGMQAISPEEWPDLRWRLHPCVRLVRVSWRVDEVAKAVMQNLAPPAPSAEDVTIVVWRMDQVNYRVAEAAEAIALNMIETGADFASICAAIAEADGDEEAPHLINRLLARWVDDGLLLRQAEG